MAVGETCNSTGAKTVVPANLVGHQEIANSLELASALLGLQPRQPSTPQLRDALAAAVNDIFAVAGIHCQLCRAESQDPVVSFYSLDLAAA